MNSSLLDKVATFPDASSKKSMKQRMEASGQRVHPTPHGRFRGEEPLFSPAPENPRSTEHLRPRSRW